MSFVIWITGPSGAGKTTPANALYNKLQELGYLSLKSFISQLKK